jgi:hypothetical protein
MISDVLFRGCRAAGRIESLLWATQHVRKKLDAYQPRRTDMKLYLLLSEEPPEEHIEPLIISAGTPQQAFALWEGHYGFPWRCLINEIPPVADEPRVMAWNPPSWFPTGEEGDDAMHGRLIDDE